jgi:hypothetical protein
MQSKQVYGLYCVVFHNYGIVILFIRPLTPPRMMGNARAVLFKGHLPDVVRDL